MKNTWKALLVIILSALGYQFLQTFIPGRHHKILKFIYLVILLVIGFFLAPNKKKNNRWVGKVILSLVIIFIFAISLDLLAVTEIKTILNTLGLTGSFLEILLIYCGWAFHQV